MHDVITLLLIFELNYVLKELQSLLLRKIARLTILYTSLLYTQINNNELHTIFIIIGPEYVMSCMHIFVIIIKPECTVSKLLT